MIRLSLTPQTPRFLFVQQNSAMNSALLTLFACICSVPGYSNSKPVPPPPVERKAVSDPYWVKAQFEVDKKVADLLNQHQAELDKGITFHKLMRGDNDRKQIALTFDDGPHPQYTPQLLSILKRYNAKATFFLVGEKAAQYPFLVRMELAAGMSIGNHTYRHVNLTRIPPEKVATEIQACGDVLKSISRRNIDLFRPPGGDYDEEVAEVSDALGYTMVLWTDDPGDYASPGEATIRARLLSRASNGGIILIHDGVQQTVDVLPSILQQLKSLGYNFVTIDQMRRQIALRP